MWIPRDRSIITDFFNCGENTEPDRHITQSLTPIPELENSLG